MGHISYTIGFCSMRTIIFIPIINRAIYFLFFIFDWKYLRTAYKNKY